MTEVRLYVESQDAAPTKPLEMSNYRRTGF